MPIARVNLGRARFVASLDTIVMSMDDYGNNILIQAGAAEWSFAVHSLYMYRDHGRRTSREYSEAFLDSWLEAVAIMQTRSGRDGVIRWNELEDVLNNEMGKRGLFLKELLLDDDGGQDGQTQNRLQGVSSW